MTTMQRDLFGTLDERIWPADEEFQMPGRGHLPLAGIKLAKLPGLGWIFSTFVNLADSGYGYPLAMKWGRSGTTRDQALQGAKAEIMAAMRGYCSGHDDSHHAKAQARKVCKWVECIQPAPTQPRTAAKETR